MFSIRSPSRFLPLQRLLASISIVPLDYFTGPYLDSMVLLYPIPRRWPPGAGLPRWSIALAAAALFSHTFCAECGAKHYGDYLEP